MNLSPSSFLSRRTSRTLGGVALLAVAFVGSSSAPEAQVDFSVGQIEVNQVIQVSGALNLSKVVRLSFVPTSEFFPRRRRQFLLMG